MSHAQVFCRLYIWISVLFFVYIGTTFAIRCHDVVRDEQTKAFKDIVKECGNGTACIIATKPTQHSARKDGKFFPKCGKNREHLGGVGCQKFHNKWVTCTCDRDECNTKDSPECSKCFENMEEKRTPKGVKTSSNGTAPAPGPVAQPPPGAAGAKGR